MRAIRSPRNASRHGFTVLELMLSVSIMTVIVIALYTVFDQTQKALRGTMAQVDVLEGVRATSDILVRDLESATPLRVANTNFTSFAAQLNPLAQPAELRGLANNPNPILRTDLQDVFFVTRQNDLWTAIGYWVGPVNTNLAGRPITVGRLYRFTFQTNNAAIGYTNLFARFNSPARILSSQPVMDGIIHFRLTAYDSDGKPLVSGLFTNTPVHLRPWFADPVDNTRTGYWFRRFTVPQFPDALELEYGVLEPPAVNRFAAIPVPAEGLKYLARNPGQIHLFRQRIRLRNAAAY